MFRRRAVRLAAAALLAAVLAGGITALGVLMSRPGLAARDRGDLTLAVVNWRTAQGDAAHRIASDPAHRAVVGQTSVTWFDATGTAYRTDGVDAATVSRLFDDNGYSDWRTEAPAAAIAGASQLALLAVIIAFAGFLVWQMRRGGMQGLSMGRSNAREVGRENRPAVRFSDVAGVDVAVAELREVVDFLRRPERYLALGARIPRGVLLAGPPGTGKTLLAKAVAGEAEVPFLSLSGSQFVEMFVGVGAARVRDLFARARKLAPCIVFVDEIDAVGRRRGGGTGNGNDEREQTLNQLLVEMDGFDSASPVLVIAATNRSDVLDPALVRPGRFDRVVHVDAPDLGGRAAILDVHAQGRAIAPGVHLRTLARQTPGFSGAELANVLNEAALLAAREDATAIDQGHLEEATARVVAGPRRAGRLMSPREAEVIAYHEMGHALVFHVLPRTDPVHRISIVSRGRALGWTMTLPEGDRVLGSRAELADQLAGLLGGRCAEEIVFGDAEVTTGAADDIARATALARRMVVEWGMSPMGLRAYADADPAMPRAHSEATAAAVDAAVDALLEEAHSRARRVLEDRRRLLDRLASRLLEVETMEATEMTAIIDGHAGAAAPPPARVIPRRGSVTPVPTTAGAHRGRLVALPARRPTVAAAIRSRLALWAVSSQR